AEGRTMAHRYAEQQVLADRRVHVVPIRIERLDEVVEALCGKLPMHQLPCRNEAFRDLRAGTGAESPVDAERVDLLLEACDRERTQDGGVELLCRADAGGGVVDPALVERDVHGSTQQRLVDLPGDAALA